MSKQESYKVTSVEVHVAGGAVIKAAVETLGGVKELLKDIKAAGIEPNSEPTPQKSQKASPTAEHPKDTSGDPFHRITSRANIEGNKLKKILGFKDGVPQLYRPGLFKQPVDAVVALVYALEVGASQNPVAYDSFSAAFGQQNIKMGSPLSMVLANLKKRGYIDKKEYEASRGVRLTAKGEKKAELVLGEVASAG